MLEIGTLTKAELIEVLAEEAELSKRQAGEIIELVLEEYEAEAKKEGGKLIPIVV